MMLSEMLKKAREYEKTALKTISNEQRPGFHFSAPTGWLNDPNGFSMYQGEYHLFFQYYPYDTHWDFMHWGHAKSRDFIKWEYLPAALAPDETYDSSGVFSGSALEDKGKQVLIYTGVEEVEGQNGKKEVRQNQCIAVGDGLNYEKLENNPVITASQLPKGSSLEDFRDPKIWKEDGRFYLVAGSRNEDGSGQIALYSAEQLDQWNFCSILARSANLHGSMWECPDFFALGEGHVLMVSPQDMHAEGLEFHNGNNVIFVTGKYDKKAMSFERTGLQSVDYGLDFYAAQTMETEDGRRIMIAWMQSWDNHMRHGDFRWSGMMTIPRELSVKNGRICQQPVRELKRYHQNEVSYDSVSIEGETRLEGISGRRTDLTIEVEEGDYEKFSIKVAANDRYYSAIVLDTKERILTFDRTYSGYGRDVISSRSMKVDHQNGTIKLRILLDQYSVEIFVNDGEQAMTSLIATPKDAEEIIFDVQGRACCSLKKYDVITE
ncbi:glycoside hydrolase family 32 protein [Lacrimispora sp. JR3]|uniref:glycoside hydrolase family 32 protein n=1 Tax=Lacrimispora sinapis TaxID=3111456 RepID=UPI003747E358